MTVVVVVLLGATAPLASALHAKRANEICRYDDLLVAWTCDALALRRVDVSTLDVVEGERGVSASVTPVLDCRELSSARAP